MKFSISEWPLPRLTSSPYLPAYAYDRLECLRRRDIQRAAVAQQAGPRHSHTSLECGCYYSPGTQALIYNLKKWVQNIQMLVINVSYFVTFVKSL